MLENKNCSHEKTLTIRKQEIYNVKGENISVDATIKKCALCDQEIFDYDLDTENLKQAYRKYKQIHNLLQSEEIIEIRKKFRLTQKMLALLVGCTQATIARYERGSIQSETHNTALTLLKNSANVRAAFETKKFEFNCNERQELEKTLSEQENNLSATFESLLEKLYDYQPSQYSGFKKFDAQKFKAAVLFFALNQADLYQTKLLKLLWYADMQFFKKNIISITGMKYIHQKYGPVPEKYSLCLSLVESLGIIEIQEREFGEVILPKVDRQPLEALSKAEMEVLKAVNSKFLYTKAKDISELSHREKAYRETEFSAEISYEYASEMQDIF